jgi:hypothetical protein
VLADPLTRGEPEDERSVEPARGSEVEILDARRHVELGDLEQTRQAPVVPERNLALEEQREPILEGELRRVAHSQLLLERLSHAGEPELVESFDGLLDQHTGSPGGKSEA